MSGALTLTRPPGWKGVDAESSAVWCNDAGNDDADAGSDVGDFIGGGSVSKHDGVCGLEGDPFSPNATADRFRKSDATPEGDRAGGVVPGQRGPRLCATSAAALSRALQPALAQSGGAHGSSAEGRSRIGAGRQRHGREDIRDVDVSALWDSTDIVRSLCFANSRKFILALESELVRLLEAPRGAVLRLPSLSHSYRALLGTVCARFRVAVKDVMVWSDTKVDIEALPESRLPLPAEALVPSSWAGREPGRWRRTTLPKAVACKPYLEMVMTPAHDFKEFGLANTDHIFLVSPSGHPSASSGRPLQNHVWEMPEEWTLTDKPELEGTVLTLTVEHTRGAGGVCIALFSDARAAAPPLRRLLEYDQYDPVHGDPNEEDPYVIMLEPCPSRKYWIADFGRASKLEGGVSRCQRAVPWFDGARSTIWLSVTSIDGRMRIEIGVDCFPWRRIFRAKLSPNSGSLRRFALAGMRFDSQNSVTLESLRIDRGLCCDLASRDHLASIKWESAKGPQPDSVPGGECMLWLPRVPTNDESTDSSGHVVVVCSTSGAASEFAALAETAGWETCTIANAPIDTIDAAGAGDVAAGHSPPSAFAATVATAREALRRRRKEVGRLNSEIALDFGFCDLALGVGAVSHGAATEKNAEEIAEVCSGGSIYELLGNGLRRGPRNIDDTSRKPNSDELAMQAVMNNRRAETLNPNARPFEPSRVKHSLVDWDWEEDADIEHGAEFETMYSNGRQALADGRGARMAWADIEEGDGESEDLNDPWTSTTWHAGETFQQDGHGHYDQPVEGERRSRWKNKKYVKEQWHETDDVDASRPHEAAWKSERGTDWTREYIADKDNMIAQDCEVVLFKSDKGFGFVQLDDRRSAFIHANVFGGGDLTMGTRLSVDLEPDKRNPQNLSVAKVREWLFVAPHSSKPDRHWEPPHGQWDVDDSYEHHGGQWKEWHRDREQRTEENWDWAHSSRDDRRNDRRQGSNISWRNDVRGDDQWHDRTDDHWHDRANDQWHEHGSGHRQEDTREQWKENTRDHWRQGSGDTWYEASSSERKHRDPSGNSDRWHEANNVERQVRAPPGFAEQILRHVGTAVEPRPSRQKSAGGREHQHDDLKDGLKPEESAEEAPPKEAPPKARHGAQRSSSPRTEAKRTNLIDRTFFRIAVEGHLRGGRRVEQSAQVPAEEALPSEEAEQSPVEDM